MNASAEPFLILHMVRGEPDFAIAVRANIGAESGWVVSSSGHRAYPFHYWPLEDLADVSDINNYGGHNRPINFIDRVPADWPDHYQQRAPATAKTLALAQLVVDLNITEADLQAAFAIKGVTK